MEFNLIFTIHLCLFLIWCLLLHYKKFKGVLILTCIWLIMLIFQPFTFKSETSTQTFDAYIEEPPKLQLEEKEDFASKQQTELEALRNQNKSIGNEL